MKARGNSQSRRPVLAAGILAGLLTAIIAVLGKAYLDQKASRKEAAAQAVKAENAARAARQETNKGERAREQAQDLVGFIMQDLSEALAPLGQSEILESVSRETLAYFENLPPDLVTPSTEEQKAKVWLGLGHARYRLGDLAGAFAADQKAITLLEKLVEMEPGNSARKDALLQARLDTAHVLASAAKYDANRTSLRIVRESTTQNSFLAEVEGGLGEVEGLTGNADLAQQHFAKAVRHASTHLETNPGDIGVRKILTITLGNAGLFASQAGNEASAEQSFRKALESARKLVSLDPDNRNWDKELATLLNNFGTSLENQGRIDEPSGFYQESLAIRQSLTDWDPNNTRWLLNLANSWHNKAAIHYHRKEAPEALASSRKALAIYKRLLTLDPRNTAWLDEMLELFDIQKDRLLELQDPDSALALSEEVTSFVDETNKGTTENFAMTKALATLQQQVGKIQQELGKSPIETNRLAVEAFAAEISDDESNEEKLALLAQSYLDFAKVCPDPAPVFALAHHVLTTIVKGDSKYLQRLRDFSKRETLLALGKHKALLPAGSTWHYYDDRQPPPSDWLLPTFDASEWKKGPAPLGYGEGNEATELSFGIDDTNKRLTAWFRQEFVLESAPTTVLLNLRRDDGALVFINGKEVVRSGLPDGKITFNTFANHIAMGFDESVFHIYQLSDHHLVPGRNVIAVEVHQNEPQSSDLALELEILDPSTLPDLRESLVLEELEKILGSKAIPSVIRQTLK